jgi:hypothetical protein
MTLCQAGEQEERCHSDGTKLDHDVLVVTTANCDSIGGVVLAQSFWLSHSGSVIIPFTFAFTQVPDFLSKLSNALSQKYLIKKNHTMESFLVLSQLQHVSEAFHGPTESTKAQRLKWH